jgi:hypothetical protein
MPANGPIDSWQQPFPPAIGLGYWGVEAGYFVALWIVGDSYKGMSGLTR